MSEQTIEKAQSGDRVQTAGWATDPLGVRDGDFFEIFEGYETTRIFEVDTNMGPFLCIGHIDGTGSLVDSMGDDFGYSFDDVSRWMFFQPNASGEAEEN